MSQRPLDKKRIVVKKTPGAMSAAKAAAKPTPNKRAVAIRSGKIQDTARRDVIVQKESKTEKGVLKCTSCGAMFYDKHWHGANVLKGMINEVGTVEALCDGCHSKVSKVGSSVAGFAGEIIVEGIPSLDVKAELVGLIRNASKRAQAKDPLERVLRIDEQSKKLMVYTSENQLAIAIGKQLHSARKGATLTITWSDDDKPVRVHLQFRQ